MAKNKVEETKEVIGMPKIPTMEMLSNEAKTSSLDTTVSKPRLLKDGFLKQLGTEAEDTVQTRVMNILYILNDLGPEKAKELHGIRIFHTGGSEEKPELSKSVLDVRQYAPQTGNRLNRKANFGNNSSFYFKLDVENGIAYRSFWDGRWYINTATMEVVYTKNLTVSEALTGESRLLDSSDTAEVAKLAAEFGGSYSK